MTTTTKTLQPRRAASTRTRPFNRDGALTVKQWAQMPEVKPPYELINGKLVQKMVTTNEHDWVTSRFMFACLTWAQSSDWRFFSQGSGTAIGERDGFIPDVMGFPPSVAIEPKATYNPPPFLAVEVLSRGTSSQDKVEKKSSYARADVQLYLLIDLNRYEISVFRLENGAYGAPRVLAKNATWQPDELPGLHLKLKMLWMP